MYTDVPIEALEVIGTTTILEDLPRRLSPVYRRRGEPGCYYFTVDEDRDGPPILSLEESAYFDELVERGDAVHFDQAIAARPQHRLVQIERSCPPEYLPAAELPTRLARACREALERASRALSRGRRDEAEQLAWCARRASEDDPLPLLLLIELVRGAVPAEELQFLERDQEAYAPQLLDHARRRARTQAEFSSIGELLDKQLRSSAGRDYLGNFHHKDAFFQKARSFFGEAHP